MSAPKETKEKNQLPKLQNQLTESGSLSHLTQFRNRLDQGSRSSSRRGSGILVQKQVDLSKLDKEVQPILQTISILQKQHSDPTEPISNGVADTDDIDKLSVNNAIPLNVNSLHNNFNQTGQPKVKLKDSQINLIGNHKTNKIGNNNWLAKLPTASSFDNGAKKVSERLKDYSSVPLLSKVDKPNDSIV